MSRAARGDKVSPLPLMEALWCERYSCLPSELESEDVCRLLLHGQVLTLFRAFQKSPDKMSQSESELVGKVLQMELDAGSRSK